jgi:hypothetical protein
VPKIGLSPATGSVQGVDPLVRLRVRLRPKLTRPTSERAITRGLDGRSVDLGGSDWAQILTESHPLQTRKLQNGKLANCAEFETQLCLPVHSSLRRNTTAGVGVANSRLESGPVIHSNIYAHLVEDWHLCLLVYMTLFTTV